MRSRTAMIVLASIPALIVSAGLTPGAEPDGKALYGSKCAICHGADGVAKPAYASKGMKNFKDPAWQKEKSDEAIRKTISEGIAEKKMPAYKDKLKAEEIEAIAKYIRTLAPGK